MITGAMSALITPLKNDKIDTETYEKLIIRQMKYGMDACVPVGTTGESATLSHKEHMECIEIAVKTCKAYNAKHGTKVKVLAGAGSNSTKEAIELARFAQKCGADGILCVTPYYNKPTQEGLYLHYKAIAESIELPVLLYNVPGRTGVNIEVETVIRLSKVKNIYGIKEASGSIEKVMVMRIKMPDFVVMSGDDMLNLPILLQGGQGVISVTGNLLPKEISDLTKLNLKEASAINNKLYDINKALFYESNPIPIKAAMHLSGLMPTLEYRLPLCNPSDECLKVLEQTLKEYEVQL
ncbi:4-hydroxy-tetrahydrodipicolinate synthase [Helicobacter sp. 11S02629-2]|uniref:4-hydroxy-tetrahydrodipicolinate synthase n=1 Tax=Helicobacter sp. 11S02629-2 TaxID=1476195 RepID=UPI000BA7D10D|nr:4-hydroxy-tetrahydrodipicolinate synthase [Helicobacter sp. 11S02629-2]PAF45315.1 4-hydroxy-tetrahydrodipicolinate synthase [Helicobacter sp. 11S02629-2]